MFDGKNILITGGTGSFGTVFLQKLLNDHKPNRVIIYSRDEMKQWEMSRRIDDSRVRFFIGDVRDRDRLYRACHRVDYIVHAAALKIVPLAEYNPIECIRTNIDGAVNVVDCAIEQKVKAVVALSTDKACNPINLYGATKLCSDKLFVAGNSYVGHQDTRFSVVRYGNVMGSRGSVIPHFIEQAKQGVVSITDPRMTRFMISLEQAAWMVSTALMDSKGGEIYVQKIPSMNIVDIARAVAPEAQQEIIGIRPGEKLHEQLISYEDSRHTVEYTEYYKILPELPFLVHRFEAELAVKECLTDFVYSSDSNPTWMSVDELQAWLKQNYSNPCIFPHG